MKYLNKLTLGNAPRGALLHEAASALASAGTGAASGSVFGPWGAAIGAAGGLASSALSQLLGRSNLNKQNEMSRQNILLSNELNRRNAIEQGVLQRQAVQGAGLNINADKGAFQVAGSSALAPQTQVNPQVFDPSIISSLVQAFQTGSNIELNKSQGKLNEALASQTDANTDKIGEEIQLILEQIHGQELSNEAQEIENKWIDSIKKSEFNLNWSKTALADLQSLTEEQQQALVPHMVKKIYSEIMLNNASSVNQRAQAREAIANALYKDEERKYYSDLINSVIANNNALAAKSKGEQDKIATELLILSKEVSWYEFNRVLDAVRAGTDVAKAIASVRASGKGMKLTPSKVRAAGAAGFEF